MWQRRRQQWQKNGEQEDLNWIFAPQDSGAEETTAKREEEKKRGRKGDGGGRRGDGRRSHTHHTGGLTQLLIGSEEKKITGSVSEQSAEMKRRETGSGEVIK